ncbi:MAG: SDR family oxidoreductase [Verrucomicrobia bacterium]|nr:SDR family oxidoreductase [Verrucomicrobiota bacterium]
MPIRNVVLVAGIHGVSGRAAAECWASLPDTQVYGLSRRFAPLPAGVEGIRADLLDRENLQRKVGPLGGITHIVFGAYIEKPTAAERSEANLAILRNLLDAVEPASRTLQHVTFYQGGKAYGADLGPFKTPAREDDPRLMPPNFYYDQEDFLRERQQGKAWHWTALRPEAIMGFGLANPMNLGMSIAVYAAISKELGLPLRFPGTEKSYRILYQITSAEILASATVWAGRSEAARNEIFNITNGDYFRWRYLWPRLAAMFDLPAADPVPTPLTVYMADKRPLWDAMVRKHKLQPLSYEQVSSWPFADAILRLMDYDNISSTIKARRAGFHDCIDTEDMFRNFFARLRRDRVIP